MKEMEEREQEVREEVARLVDKKALDEMPQMRFRRLMNDDDILGELSKYILDQIYKGDMGGGNIKVGDMKDILKTIDKTLYLQLLDSRPGGGRKMSFDQFKTRAFERLQKKGADDRYFCLDDLRDILPRQLSEAESKTMEQILKSINQRGKLSDVTLSDSLRNLEDWETNKRCLRSIFNIGSQG